MNQHENQHNPLKYETLKDPDFANSEGGLGAKLYRIRALRDFGEVKRGDFGGFIESEKNLSHQNDCWVFDDSMVFGDAKVSGNASISGRSQIFGNSQISGNAEVNGSKVFGDAKVSGNASISGSSLVFGDAKVSGNSQISDGSQIFGDAKILGSSEISRSQVFGNRQIADTSISCGSIWNF